MMATQREQKALAEGVLVGRIRTLQSVHDRAHRALLNWGLWSLDRADIYPRLKPPSVWDQFARSKIEEWGEEGKEVETEQPAKAEGPEREPYDEKQAIAIDVRLHGFGGLSQEIRYTLKVAYVSRETPESQFPRNAGCSEDAFCERLETALMFVNRYI